MRTYMSHINKVWNTKAHLCFILKILKTPSNKPRAKPLIFTANLDLLNFKNSKKTTETATIPRPPISSV